MVTKSMPEPRDQWLLTKIISFSFFDREAVGGTSLVKRLDDEDNAPLSKFLPQTCFSRSYSREGIHNRSSFYPQDENTKE